MNVDLGAAFSILLDSGLEIIGGDSEQVLLRRGSSTRRYKIVLAEQVDDLARVLADRKAATASGYALLYVVERATDALRQTAGIDVAFVAVRERSGSVAGRTWPEQAGEQARPRFALCALARVLLSTSSPIFRGPSVSSMYLKASTSQSSLASIIGVSQSHVSVLLRQLPVGSVRQLAGGWAVNDFDRLWDWHVSVYSGPKGLRLAWRSNHQRATQLRNLRKVTSDAAFALNRGRKSAQILLSGFEAVPAPLQGSVDSPGGELGEQLLVDRRGPVTMFNRHVTSSLTEMGYTPCDSFDSTVQLVQPADPTVYGTAAAWGNARRTDPLVTAWELTHEPQRDPRQAAALREWARAHAEHIGQTRWKH
jgi:small neutral amino acid transporter SnatA (MarC family)